MHCSLTTDGACFREMQLHGDTRRSLVELCAALGIQGFNGWVCDPEYRVGRSSTSTSIADVYMVHSTLGGEVNPVATRILMDNLLLEPAVVRDDATELMQTCPRGNVVFCACDTPSGTIVDLPLIVLQSIWHTLFRENMPYTQLLADVRAKQPKYPLRAACGLYKRLLKNDSLVWRIATTYLQVPRRGDDIRSSDLDKVFCTVHSAALAVLFEAHGFLEYNTFDTLRQCKMCFTY